MSKHDNKDDGYFEGYAQFAGVLRTWLIAYGIGGPVLFVTQAQLADKLSKSGQAHFIASLFLAGVFLQVVVALLYKGAMWYLYVGEEDEDMQKRKRYIISSWLAESFWLEMLFDLASIALFMFATSIVLDILTSTVIAQVHP
ncbi:MAG: hypothetical protein M0R70_02755 [Nitrospirae bacterium]|nr:hypothetical protein [Nitrospirota bacterium]